MYVCTIKCNIYLPWLLKCITYFIEAQGIHLQEKIDIYFCQFALIKRLLSPKNKKSAVG